MVSEPCSNSPPSSPKSNMSGSHDEESTLSVNRSMKDLTVVNFPSTLKLSATNYLGWKTQIEALLHGLDLHKFIDGTFTAPTSTIETDGTTVPHKDYVQWFRQDKLLFGALVGSLSPEIVPLITNASSSHEAWKILAGTYASPSRGHIKQLQYRLKQITKTPNQTITNYMQNVKTIVDELAILGKKLDQEDITDAVLNGLDQSAYKPILDAVHARDLPISFNELHEKLINQELSIAQQINTAGINQPASVFYAQNQSAKGSWQHRNRSPNTGLLPTPYRPPTQSIPTTGSRPFLGKCQWCNQKGHTLRNCSVFKRIFPNTSVPVPNNNLQVAHAQAHTMAPTNISTPDSWIFDSGASFHATNDLNNLSLHAPYNGTEELVIGDGSGNTKSNLQGHGDQGAI